MSFIVPKIRAHFFINDSLWKSLFLKNNLSQTTFLESHCETVKHEFIKEGYFLLTRNSEWILKYQTQRTQEEVEYHEITDKEMIEKQIQDKFPQYKETSLDCLPLIGFGSSINFRQYLNEKKSFWVDFCCWNEGSEFFVYPILTTEIPSERKFLEHHGSFQPAPSRFLALHYFCDWKKTRKLFPERDQLFAERELKLSKNRYPIQSLSNFLDMELFKTGPNSEEEDWGEDE